MLGTLSTGEEAQLAQTIEMFEVITQSQPMDYQSLEILKEAYSKLNRHKDVTRTSKRIAQAYVQLGQLSSAILEYETILQHSPDDPDALAAIAEIESRANSLTAMPVVTTVSPREAPPVLDAKRPAIREGAAAHPAYDDGRAAMQKLFLDAKLIVQSDFEACWPTPSMNEVPSKVVEPFIHVAAEKSIIPVDKSLRLLVDKARLGYIPLEKYDIDVELSRTFSRDTCRRWCVLPFDKMSKSLFVATTNPFNNQAARELQHNTELRILWYLVPPQDLIKVLGKVFR